MTTCRAVLSLWQRIRDLEAENSRLRRRIYDLEYPIYDPGC